MNKILSALVLFSALIFAQVSNAACAGGTCFAIATGNWGTAGTWSIVSGGVSCVCTPATGDAIVMDAASGAVTLTMEAAYSIATLDATGFTGTFVQNAFTLTVTGNTFKLVAGMTYAPSAATRLITFTSTSGTTAITTAAKTLGSITINGTGGTFQIQDALNYRSDGTLTMTVGTFDANNFNVTGGLLASTGGTITMGSGTWLLNSPNSNVVNIASGTTLNANTSTLSLSATLNGSRGFISGGKTYNNVVIDSGGATGGNNINGAPTFANLTITNTRNVSVTQFTGLTITGNFTYSGTSTTQNTLTAGSQTGTITLTVSGAISLSWLYIQNITKAGAGSISCTNCFDGGVNTGVTISIPSSGGGKIIGGWLLDPANDNTPMFLAKVA